MSMKLYAHPFSSYCQKVLIALYENDTPFEFRMLAPGDERAAAEAVSGGGAGDGWSKRCGGGGAARGAVPEAARHHVRGSEAARSIDVGILTQQ